MNLNLTDHILHGEKSNRSLYDHLSNLFIDEWTTTLNYSKYFDSCNPSVCTYTTTDIIDYSYAVTLFISLYGGLVLILRSISPFLINILLKFRYRQTNENAHRASYYRFSAFAKTCLQNFIQWTKQLNLFKSIKKRTEEDIQQQRLISKIYLILLTSRTIFHSLDFES